MKESALEKFLNTNAGHHGFAFGIASLHSSDAADGALHQLSPQELVAYRAKRNEKRRREWLAGRIAAKRALGRLLNINDEKTLVILNGRNRAPFVLSHPNVTVSITHSREFAVAVAAHFKIGVDLEHIEARPPALLNYFFGDQEKSALPIDDDEKDKLVSLFWTRKEAASKVVKLGGALDFKKLNVAGDSAIIEHQGKVSSVKFLSSTTEKYAISVAIDS